MTYKWFICIYDTNHILPSVIITHVQVLDYGSFDYSDSAFKTWASLKLVLMLYRKVFYKWILAILKKHV